MLWCDIYVAASIVSSTLFLFFLCITFSLRQSLENGSDFPPIPSDLRFSNLHSFLWFISASLVSYFFAWDWNFLICNSTHLQRHISGCINVLQWDVNLFFLEYQQHENIKCMWHITIKLKHEYVINERQAELITTRTCGTFNVCAILDLVIPNSM